MVSVSRSFGAALAVCAGCSLIGVRPSPSINETTGTAVCASFVAPAADVAAIPALALAGAGVNAVGHAIRECGSNSTDPNCQTPWQAYIPAGIAALSAIYGFWAVHHCNTQLDAMHDAYLATHPEEGPMPVPPR